MKTWILIIGLIVAVTLVTFQLLKPNLTNQNPATPETKPVLTSSPTSTFLKNSSLSFKPLAFPIANSAMADYFNQVAKDNDLALIQKQNIAVLSSINKGQKVVVYASWAEAETQLDSLKGQVEYIGYNPEHWQNTPLSEKQNFVSTITKASQSVHSRGFKFLVAPDRQFADSYAKEIGKYADMVVFQGQRLQSDTDQFSSWINQKAASARSLNPNVKVYAQVIASNSQEAVDALNSVSSQIDGIVIWSNVQNLDNLKEIISQIR